MKSVIQKDLYRFYKKGGLYYTILYYTIDPAFRYIFLLRKYQTSHKIFKYFYRILMARCGVKYGIQIGRNTQIGAGIKLRHLGLGVIIHGDVVVGENCDIYQGVTIGQTNRGKYKGTPIIGNKVWIGANAVIVGNVTIGDNVLIAPLTYVNIDVPNNSLVIGNPAKIISKENATEGYIDNVFE